FAWRALAVDPDRQLGRFAQTGHELAGPVGLQRPGRVVEQDARRPEARQLARLLHQRIGLIRPSRAVDEAGLELAAGLRHRVSRLTQVRDVVERVVQAEDVDAVRSRRRDETPDEVVVHRTRADEEAAAQREPERRLDARLQRANALPRALDAAADRALEAPAAGHLEVREAGFVENLGNAQLLGGGQ